MATEREIATQTCPKCGRRQNVLADEVGEHGCPCGWNPLWDDEDNE